MKLPSNAAQVLGRWVLVDGKVSGDEACRQIEWLTTHHLRKLAISEQSGAWETLFQDPDDDRFWEQTYPQGEMHGGGPPRLMVLTLSQARSKYRFD